MTTEELLRFAFTQSSKQTIVGTTVFPGWSAHKGGPSPYTWDLLATTAGVPPGRANPGRAARLPFGTVDLLEGIPFPRYPVRWAGPRRDQLGHALIAAFGPQRREPANLYNDHRGIPSVRSKFPVHAFVTRDGRHHWLDVYRHALLDMGVSARPDDQDRILLTARYSDLPAPYGKLRGALTELELGINLRALCVALDLFAVPYRVDLPDAAAESALGELGLDPAWGWTLPVAVRPWPVAGPAAGKLSPPLDAAPDDPVLGEVVAMNRTAMLRPADTPLPEASSVPGGAAGPAAGSWAEVLWARSSGTMPRGLKGLAGRRQRRPFSLVQDALGWIGAMPPSQILQQVARLLSVTVCLQDIDGHASGVYRLADGTLNLVRENGRIGADLERDYGHRQEIDVGCGVRVASAIWFVSVRPRSLADQFGPWAWPLALLLGGWMTQGLCLAAAAHGQYARPARAFQEIPAQPLLDLAPDEVFLITVTCGTPRFTESRLDLRL